MENIKDDSVPKWADDVLNNPVAILVAAKHCISNSGTSDCFCCPFEAWDDCDRILLERLDKLIKHIEKEKENE